ncbi:MAG: hypothetical protein KAI81_06770, partial [Candidatus Marinimicrobia bacterium]|nr:hypothetical protein [Candidatus Neomarinimicrobiota bacterium]
LASAIEPYSFSDIRELLKEKSRHKHLVCCKKGDFISDRKKSYIARAWESSLYNHLPPGKLIEFETAYVKVEKFVEQIITEG